MKPVISPLSCKESAALPCPVPVIQIGVSVYFFATSSDAKNTQAAPSVTSEQSNSRKGEAIIGFDALFKKSISSFQSGMSLPWLSNFLILLAIISLKDCCICA